MVMLNAYVYVYVYAHAYVHVLKLSPPLSVLTGHRYLLCFFFLFYLSILGYCWLWFIVHINLCYASYLGVVGGLSFIHLNLQDIDNRMCRC